MREIDPASAAGADAAGKPLYAEPIEAIHLITQGTNVSGHSAAKEATAATGGGAGAASPFDAVVQAAVMAIPAEDSAAAAGASTSSTTHAGGSTAAVGTVVDEDLNSAADFEQATPGIDGICWHTP